MEKQHSVPQDWSCYKTVVSLPLCLDIGVEYIVQNLPFTVRLTGQWNWHPQEGNTATSCQPARP